MINIGTDLVEIQRIQKFIDSKKETELLRIFTQNEIDYSTSSTNQYQRFAARFAVKEAFFKAFGAGRLSEIEVSNDKDNKPSINLLGNTKKKWETLSSPYISISISHTDHYAMACVLIEYK